MNRRLPLVWMLGKETWAELKDANRVSSKPMPSTLLNDDLMVTLTARCDVYIVQPYVRHDSVTFGSAVSRTQSSSPPSNGATIRSPFYFTLASSSSLCRSISCSAFILTARLPRTRPSTFPVPSQATHASRYFESQRGRAEQKNDSCSRNRTNGLAVSACQLVACRRVTIFGGAVQIDGAPRNQRTSGLCVGCGGERSFTSQKL